MADLGEPGEPKGEARMKGARKGCVFRHLND